MADSLDRSVVAELLAQSADTDVDDVGTGVEVVAPDLGEQPLATDHLTLVLDQVMKDPELPVRKLCLYRSELRLAARKIEDEGPRLNDVSGVALLRLAKLDPDPRDQLVE